MIEIKNRWTDALIFRSETATTMREALLEAIAAKDDLSGADLREADLRGADLREADLRGADLRGAVLSGAVLSGADLSGADLSGADLSGAVLSEADLREADLSGAVLRGADLSEADLRGADLSGAVLSGAVLRGACGFTAESVTGPSTPVPKLEKIHQRVLAAISAEGCKLDMGHWHTCDTTHCRAGWVVHLAGPAGRELERKIGTGPAAMRIYLESDPGIQRLPRFHVTDEKAMADIVECAERERQELGPLDPTPPAPAV